MAKNQYDFAGWATRANLRCSDGRVIKSNAFADCDGRTVPLVWNHDHSSPASVLGHALLQNRNDGVYAFCKFNNTQDGQIAKECVRNGDVNALSIYANHLKQNGNEVLHGAIREVSLVLAGANPGAFITDIAHSDDANTDDFSAQIFTGEYIEHSDGIELDDGKDDPNEGQENNTMNNNYQLNHADEGMEAPDENGGSDETVKDVFNTLSEKQKKAVYIIVAQAVQDAKGGSGDEGNSDEEDEEMKHNVFADGDETYEGAVLTHSDMEELAQNSLADAKKFGSLRDAVMAHADQDYGIKDIDILFPDARTITSTPEFIKREDGWVSKVMNGTHHTPFSRIKSVFADITADDARAKGYMKGKLKKEEVFTLLKRTTDPQTIYKKQKIDRDDAIDITDFDVLAWLKGEMRIMLDEEIARAIVYGDGRLADSEDKIDPSHIRPITTDADLYTIKKTLEGTTAEDIAKVLVDEAVMAMDEYKGSGNPIGLIRQDIYTRCLLLKDGQGYRLYKTPAELATAMMCKELVPVPNDIAGTNYLTMVNLDDYSVGADKGGAVSMFDDFDIDYNQQKYLIETRCSGAMTKPYGAIAFKKPEA